MISFSRFLVRVFIFTTIIVFFSITSIAQQTIIVNSKVDYFIDSVENFRYLIFLDSPFEEIKGIQFFKYPNEKYKMLVYLKDNSTLEKELNKNEIDQIKYKIKNQENSYNKYDTISLYSITLTNGKFFQSRIKSFTNTNIELDSEIFEGEIILTKDVKRVININEGQKKDIGKIENPDFSRYFFASTAIPLNKGEGYIQDIHIFYISCNYAFTNHLMVGAGFSYVPETDMQLNFLLNGRVNYKLTEKFYLSGGGLYYNDGAMSKTELLGYANGTYGTKNTNTTLGLLYGYHDNGLMNYPVLTLSGMTRISKHFSLVTENWFGNIAAENYRFYNIIDLDQGLFCMFSFGFRFFSENISFDVALFDIYESNSVLLPDFPYIDFIYRF